MVQQQYVSYREFTWCEVKQTEVHEEPYDPPTSDCDYLLVRLATTLYEGDCQIETSTIPPQINRLRYIVTEEEKVWVSLSSEEKLKRSWRDLSYALCGIEDKDRIDIVRDIVLKVRIAVRLPQLAIDVNIRLIGVNIYGSFEGYDDERLLPHLKKAWAAEFSSPPHDHEHDMPSSSSSCCICLEDFGAGVEDDDDKLIVRLPCSHYVHGYCSAHWVMYRHTCPLCRSLLLPVFCDGNEPPFNPNPTDV